MGRTEPATGLIVHSLFVKNDTRIRLDAGRNGRARRSDSRIRTEPQKFLICFLFLFLLIYFLFLFLSSLFFICLRIFMAKDLEGDRWGTWALGRRTSISTLQERYPAG